MNTLAANPQGQIFIRREQLCRRSRRRANHAIRLQETAAVAFAADGSLYVTRAEGGLRSRLPGRPDVLWAMVSTSSQSDRAQ